MASSLQCTQLHTQTCEMTIKTRRHLFLILSYPFQLPAAQAQFLFNQVSFCLLVCQWSPMFNLSMPTHTIGCRPSRCSKCSSHSSNVNTLTLPLRLFLHGFSPTKCMTLHSLRCINPHHLWEEKMQKLTLCLCRRWEQAAVGAGS